MLARGRRLQFSKLSTLRGPLGFPDDYLRVLPALTDPLPARLTTARWRISIQLHALLGGLGGAGHEHGGPEARFMSEVMLV
jgi:hypothetical protein